MQTRSSKLDELRKKRDDAWNRLNAQVAEAQRLEDIRQRKADTRYKIVFGSCLLADFENNPDLGVLFEESLKRTANPRDAEFLRSRGWRI